MRLLQNSLLVIRAKGFKLVGSYILIQFAKIAYMVLFSRIAVSSNSIFSILNTLVLSLIDALLFMSIYRIIFENRSIIRSYKFENSTILAFMGYINLNFIIYFISYLLGFAQGTNDISKIILILAKFVFIFVPILALKGNIRLLTSTRESVVMIQEDSKELLGLFIVFVTGTVVSQFFGNFSFGYTILFVVISNFNPYIFEILAYFGSYLVIGLIIDAIVMILTIFSIVMIQKHCEYR